MTSSFSPQRETGSWLQRSLNRNASFRLFCFPPSGVGSSLFQTWHRYLTQEIEVCAIQLPGRETRFREAPYENLASLVDRLVEVLPAYFDLPFAFYGHSMGAILSFELVRKLRRLNIAGPAHLFVAAYRAPHLSAREKPIHKLPDGEFLAELSRRYEAIPQELLESSELLELFLPPLRADFTMLEEWDFSEEALLDCPLSAFGGLQDQSVTRDELVAWGTRTSSTFDLTMLPGGHLFVRNSYPLLLRAISNKLDGFLNR